MDLVWSPPASAETIASGWPGNDDDHFTGLAGHCSDNQRVLPGRALTGPAERPSDRPGSSRRPLSGSSPTFIVVTGPTRTMLVTSRKVKFVRDGSDRTRKGRTQGWSDVQRVELAQPSCCLGHKTVRHGTNLLAGALPLSQ